MYIVDIDLSTKSFDLVALEGGREEVSLDTIVIAKELKSL